MEKYLIADFDKYEEIEHIFYPLSFVDSEKRLVYLAYENARQHYLNIYTFEELGI